MSSANRSSPGLITLLCSAAAFTACGRDPAPADVDGALHWIYANVQDASPTELSDAVVKIHASVEGATLKDAIKEKLLPLTAKEIVDLGLPASTDPTKGQGMLVVTEIPCSLEDVVKLDAQLDQNAIHGGYDAYRRTYTSNSDDFFSHKVDTLTWSTDYTVSSLGSTYNANIHAALKQIDGSDTTKFPLGSFAIGRAHLAKPAVFTAGDSDNHFEQDYQLDLFYERAPKQTIHVFGLWRQMKLSGHDASDTLYIYFLTNSLANADDDVAKLCNK